MKFNLFLKQRSPCVDDYTDSHRSALIFLSFWLILLVGIWLSWFFWCLEWSWLWSFDLVVWISLNFWGLTWVKCLITSLDAITNVYA